MQSSTFTLETRDAVPVHVYRWLPDGAVRGVVQIAHGLAEHGQRYTHVAEALTGAGYAVYADDHRGHGRTAKGPDDLGLFAEERGWATVLDDLYRLNRTAHAEYPDVPIHLLGHSTGSLLAQQFLSTFPGEVDGAVLSGSIRHRAADVELISAAARAECARLGPRGHSPLLKWVTVGRYNDAFAPTRTDHDWLTRDSQMVDAYAADPLCGFDCAAKTYQDIAGGMRVIRQTNRLLLIPPQLPIYLFSGDKDQFGDAGRGVQRLVDAYTQAGLQRVTHRLYPDARHEMLNETNRDEVIADLLAWLDATTKEVNG